MNLFKWLAGGADAATKVLDAGIKGIDALVFTEEEKANMRKELGAQWIDTQKVLLAESSVRSVTRRFVALTIMGAFTILILGAAVAFPFNKEYASFLVELAQGNFGVMTLGVGTFYFGPMIQRFFPGKV